MMMKKISKTWKNQKDEKVWKIYVKKKECLKRKKKRKEKLKEKKIWIW